MNERLMLRKINKDQSDLIYLKKMETQPWNKEIDELILILS